MMGFAKMHKDLDRMSKHDKLSQIKSEWSNERASKEQQQPKQQRIENA